MNEHRFTNRLSRETSPYLLQHAHNPVDWWPWSEEALQAARESNKPIFLSIGYSACHWCHVMERESFENEATARVLNELFVNIKVDREERPDLDQIYMSATQLITRHGGWPMSVWLTPDLKPFYAGTYFPPEPRHGMPAFTTLCQYLGSAWRDRRDEVIRSAEEVVQRVVEMGSVRVSADPLDPSLIVSAAQAVLRYFDPVYGGIGEAPKFPHSTELRLMMRAAVNSKSEEKWQVVFKTLDHMIRGGIYDQLGGGFHRYSTDQRWLVPHFEKMLYDNALISLACLEAAQLTADDDERSQFRRAADETLDYVLREMTTSEGAFASTQDADSEGVEGKFFVWSKAEVEEVLGKKDAEPFCYAYDVSDAGNWEHANILHLAKPIAQTAQMLRMDRTELEEILRAGRAKLLERRSGRIAPGRDDKVLTAWNGMMIDTLAVADGGQRGRYAEAAERAAHFILTSMKSPSGLLYRTSKGGRAHLNAYLEDYSYLANGLVSLYEATFDPRWIDEALKLVDVMIREFWDENEGGFFYTGNTHEKLITRTKDPQDGAIPSGNSMAATALARLAKLTGDSALFDRTERTLQAFRSVMEDSALAAAQLTIALGIHRGPTAEIAFIADPTQPVTKAALSRLGDRFLPNKVVALRRADGDGGPVALLAGKTGAPDELTTYICRDFACQAPVIGLTSFERALDDLVDGRAS